MSAQQVKGEIEVRFDLIRFLLAVAFRIHEPSFEHPLLPQIPFVKEANNFSAESMQIFSVLSHPLLPSVHFVKEGTNISDQTMQKSIG